MRPKEFASTLLLSALFAMPALAESVEECDWRAGAAAIAEPWEDNSQVFANGAVRIALSDVLEPAAGGFHLIVLSPPYTEIGDRQCRVVTTDDGVGYPGLKVGEAKATYDPATGLTFRIPAARYDMNVGAVYDRVLVVTLNQATGAIAARLE